MKAKKAVKRLHRAEELLGTVIDEYTDAPADLHALLDAARASVASAAQTLAEPPAKKPAANARKKPARKTA
jgi:hypothetical protein